MLGKVENSLQVEYLPLATLLPYARNSRTHDDAQVAKIAASIREFGFTNPVLVSERNDIIAGHGRVKAAALLKLADVPCIRLAHLTETQRKAYVIADNRLALNAGWDSAMLTLELKDLDAADFNLELLGFGGDELEALLNPEVEPSEGLTDPDDVPENVETRCKPGDLWALGAHRLLIGDSTSQSDVDRLLGGEAAELCFTSPPYADQRQYNGGKELSTEHLATFIRTAHGKVKLFAVNLGLSRKDGEVNQYWDDYIKEAKACGLKLLSWNVWDKGECGSIGNQTAMFGICHEWILVFGESRKTLNHTVPNKSAGSRANHTGNRQTDGTIKQSKERIVAEFSQLRTVFSVSAQKARDDIDHPARFPVEFPQGYIEACTNPGDWVYEPFGGSGTTMIAAEKLGRRSMLMELDPKYGDVILARWEAFTGKVAVLDSKNGG